MACEHSRRVLAAATIAFLLNAAGADAEQSISPLAAMSTAAQTTDPTDWGKFADQYLEAYFAANPSIAVDAGRHEFDGEIPDWSATRLRSEVARLEQQRVKTLAFVDATLTQEQRFQRDYLISQIDKDLFWLRDMREPFTNPAYYLYNGLDPNTYVTVPYAPLDQRLRAFTKYAKAIPKASAQIRANLETPLPKTFVDYGIAAFHGFAEFYRNDAPLAFAEVKEGVLQSDLKEALTSAARAMDDLGSWLDSEKSRANDGYALGPERFASMLRKTEGVTTPLGKLEAIGRADLERNLAALTAACADYVPAGTIVDCVAKQAANKPEGGAVEGARNQLMQLRQYVVDHNIVSIPGAEAALVMKAPPYKRENFAYINIPGPYEDKLPSVYFIAPPDPAWPKAEQDAYLPGKADLLFTSVHEVWPGHFLQFLHSSRSSWRFGRVFVGYAFAEGWAHYAEELMVEEGLAKDAPELHVGQLLNALLRNVRLICAIELHTKGLTVGECEQMFRENAYQDPGNARQQAARGTFDPAYLNYTIGKLMIRKLRADWRSENHGRPDKEFHDKFLSYGGPPIPLLRSQMLKRDSGELF